MTLLDRLPWSPSKTACPRGLGGNITGLHTSFCNRNSGCNSTTSCKYTRLWGRSRNLHRLGHGRMRPRRQPRRRLILLSCRCLHSCLCTGCRHWRIDASLRTHFVIVDDIHCGLSTHLYNFPKVWYNNSNFFVAQTTTVSALTRNLQVA